MNWVKLASQKRLEHLKTTNSTRFVVLQVVNQVPAYNMMTSAVPGNVTYQQGMGYSPNVGYVQYAGYPQNPGCISNAGYIPGQPPPNYNMTMQEKVLPEVANV